VLARECEEKFHGRIPSRRGRPDGNLISAENARREDLVTTDAVVETEWKSKRERKRERIERENARRKDGRASGRACGFIGSFLP